MGPGRCRPAGPAARCFRPGAPCSPSFTHVCPARRASQTSAGDRGPSLRRELRCAVVVATMPFTTRPDFGVSVLLSVRSVIAAAGVLAAAAGVSPAAASGVPAATAARALPDIAGGPAAGAAATGGTGAVASIAGIVLGAGDRPVRGVCVAARRLGGAGGGVAAAAAGRTGAGGRYALATGR
jgi:hypothetical protein